jgi:hypothetical protein
MVRPSILSHQPAQYSAMSATRAASARQSRIGLPVLAHSSRASASASRRSSAPSAQIRRPRSAAGRAIQARCARAAPDAAARATSSPASA